jgi:hypothetical protein
MNNAPNPPLHATLRTRFNRAVSRIRDTEFVRAGMMMFKDLKKPREWFILAAAFVTPLGLPLYGARRIKLYRDFMRSAANDNAKPPVMPPVQLAAEAPVSPVPAPRKLPRSA